MQLEIRKSKTQNSLCIVLSVSALIFFLCSTFSQPVILAEPESGLFLLPVLVLFLATICFITDYLDTTPLLIINEAGMNATAKNIFLQWEAIRSFKIKYINQRYVTLKVLHLLGPNQQVLLTLVLTGTDCSEKTLQELLASKVKQQTQK